MFIQKSPPIDCEVVDNGTSALTLFRKVLVWFPHVQACTTHGAEADETCAVWTV